MEERFNIIFQSIGGRSTLNLFQRLKDTFVTLQSSYVVMSAAFARQMEQMAKAGDTTVELGKAVEDVVRKQGSQLRLTKEQIIALRHLSEANLELRKTLLYMGFGFWIAGATIRSFASGFMRFTKTSIDSLAKFDWAITRVGILLNATNEDIKRLRELTKRWAATTIYSLTDIAEAEEKLALAGFNMNQIIESMPGIIQLASLEGMDLASATDIAAATMHAYNLEAADMVTITNSMAITSAESAIEVADLGESLKYAGAQAGLLGLSVVDVNAVLGVAGQQMIRGGRAGRYLAFGLQRLVKNGYTLERGLLPVLRQLEEETRNMTKEQQLNYLTTLVGARSARLFAAILQKGTDEVERFVKMQDQAIVKQALQREVGDDARKTFIEMAKNIRDVRTLQETLQKNFELSNTEIQAFVSLWSMGGDVLSETANSWNKILTASGIAAKQMKTVEGALRILNDSLYVLKVSLLEPLAPLIKLVARVLSFFANIISKLPAPLRFIIGLSIAMLGIFGMLVGKTLYFAGAVVLLASSLVQLQMSGATTTEVVAGMGMAFAFAKRQILGAAVATRIFTRTTLGWLSLILILIDVLWYVAEKLGWFTKLAEWFSKLGKSADETTEKINRLTYGASPGGLVDLIKYSREASKVVPEVVTTERTIQPTAPSLNVNIYNPTITDIESLESFRRVVSEAVREAVKEVEWELS